MTGQRINHKDLRYFAAQVLAAAGTKAGEAQAIADILVWSDLVGRTTQGVWRLTVMASRLRAGFIRSPCTPEYIQKADGIAVVDGHDGFGQYVGQVATLKGIELARRTGVGLVAVRNSNHYGAGAYYAGLAAQEGMIGFAFTNATRRVAAHGGLTPLFGTNPVSFGAPLHNGQSVLIDFSTGAMAGSVIRKATETNAAIPEGIAIDARGGTVTDPQAAQRATLLPFGGAKGYCLSLLVEILAGVLTDSLMSFQIPTMHEKTQTAARIGHLFLIIDIARLLPTPEYHRRMETLLAAIKASHLQEGVTEVLIPGESRWRNYAGQVKEGVLLDAKTIESLEALAAGLEVPTPW